MTTIFCILATKLITMKYRKLRQWAMLFLIASAAVPEAMACTGITLRSKDGGVVLARTIEWGGSDLESRYVIVPRGYEQHAMLPSGEKGMAFKAKYGYAGFSVEMEAFVAEGLNEAGLSAGLFYFPGYGSYADMPSDGRKCVPDLQLVSYILSTCSSIEDVRKAVGEITVIALDPRASTVHWRFADNTGEQVVLEIIGGRPVFYENRLGVLTNSPSFDWQMTNLNNYVNLHSGSAQPAGTEGMQLRPFGAGSGFLGLPGDVTPPSRFVRAAFYQTSAPVALSADDAVLQCFQILNNFDIPIGTEFAQGEKVTGIPSATQWTSASDVKGLKIYYRTMYNSAIRCIDLNGVDFSTLSYTSAPLDVEKRQPVINIEF